MDINTEGIGHFIGLHEQLRVIYVVDGYHAIIETQDGDREVASADGPSVAAAIDSLEKTLRANGITDYKGVRSYAGKIEAP